MEGVSIWMAAIVEKVELVSALIDLDEIVDRAAGGDRFKITRRGKPICALVSLKDLKFLEFVRSVMEEEDEPSGEVAS
jgi:prevent-host-death family protein